MGNPKSLEALMNPKSIAIIGASGTPGKIGYQIFKNLVSCGYSGKIYPVNPGATEVLGVKAYPSIKDVPEPVDLAGIVLPNKVVPSVMEECAQRGVKVAIIYSGGFAEASGEGVELQRKVVEAAKKSGIRILGPNVNGIINNSIKLNIQFNDFGGVSGPASLLTQSGALGSGIYFRAISEYGFGFNKFMSFENRADINEIDGLEYLAEDPSTEVIALYIEAVSDGKKFMELAKRTTKHKPIVALKVGVTEAGKRASMSHTGSLAGSDEVYDSMLRQSGVIRVHEVTEMLDAVEALAYQPVPKGNNVCICTMAGGLGIMCADICEKLGLKLPVPSEETQQAWKKFIPAFGSARNPVDLTGSFSTDMLKGVIEVALRDKSFDSVIATGILSSWQTERQQTDAWLASNELAREMGKPLICCLMGGRERMQEGVNALREKKIPVYPTPERAAKALFALAKRRMLAHAG